MVMMMAVTMNSIRTRFLAARRQGVRFLAAMDFGSGLYYGYQGFSRWTCAVLDHFLLSLREQSPASNSSGTAPTSQGVATTWSGCI